MQITYRGRILNINSQMANDMVTRLEEKLCDALWDCYVAVSDDEDLDATAQNAAAEYLEKRINQGMYDELNIVGDYRLEEENAD